MITQHLQQIFDYHVEFKFCVVSKPLPCQKIEKMLLVELQMGKEKNLFELRFCYDIYEFRFVFH